MSATLKPLTVEEFLAWERAQPLRYEFSGIQPVARTGNSRAHSRIQARMIGLLGNRVRLPCEVHGSELKVLTQGRVRYPDASVVCGDTEDEGDIIQPTVVFEVLSPSTALTDRRVKAAEYAAVPGILAYVMLETERPEIIVRRRGTGWAEEAVGGLDAVLNLPEIDVDIPLAAIYG